jgi:hypothetical protein
MNRLSRYRVLRAKSELKEVEYTLKSIDQLTDQLRHNRELAVMRRDTLLKEIGSDDLQKQSESR